VIAESLSIVGLNITELSDSTERYNTSRSELISIKVSFTLELFPPNIISTVKNIVLQTLMGSNYLTSDDDIVVLGFQPNCKKLEY